MTGRGRKARRRGSRRASPPARLRLPTVVLAAAVALLIARMRPQSDVDEQPAWEPAMLARLAEWQPRTPRSTLGSALTALWASPMTLAGLFAAASTGARPRVTSEGILVTNARGPLAAELRRRGFSATTLGHVVIAVSEPSPALLAHERLHTRQVERLGPFFGPVYLVFLAAYGYRRHPFERAARIAGRATSRDSR